jgi:hypothetical protein
LVCTLSCSLPFPKDYVGSDTFVGFDAFSNAVTRLGSGWHPSLEKIWPKNSSVSFKNLHLLALSRRPLSERRFRHICLSSHRVRFL